MVRTFDTLTGAESHARHESIYSGSSILVKKNSDGPRYTVDKIKKLLPSQSLVCTFMNGIKSTYPEDRIEVQLLRRPEEAEPGNEEGSVDHKQSAYE